MKKKQKTRFSIAAMVLVSLLSVAVLASGCSQASEPTPDISLDPWRNAPSVVQDAPNDSLKVVEFAKQYRVPGEKRFMHIYHEDDSIVSLELYALFDEKREKLEITEDIQPSLQIISDSYLEVGRTINFIIIQPDRIDFVAFDETAHTPILVYTDDGNEPTYSANPGDDIEFIVKKLQRHWYLMTSNF